MSLYTRQSSSPPPITHHRTQRSVSATAALQTVSPRALPFKTSISIPIPSSNACSSIAITTPNSSAPSNTTSATENPNPLFLSTSAPPHPLSPPSPPSSHTPIHISPATSPRVPLTPPSALPEPIQPTHPTIAGFDAKTNTDSSSDTDTDTDADADIDTDSGDHSQGSSSSNTSNPATHVFHKSAFTPAQPITSGLDYYLRTMQNHFQSLHPSLATHTAKLSKSTKRMKKLQQLQQQLAQHVGLVEMDGGALQSIHIAANVHTNGSNSTKGNKKDKQRNNNCSTPTSSTPPSKPASCIISNSLPTPPTTKGRRNSNPQSRRNSNPQARRNSNSNPNSRRNSNPPAVSLSSTPTSTCNPIPETDTPSSGANVNIPDTASAPNAITTPITLPRSTTPTQSTVTISTPPTSANATQTTALNAATTSEFSAYKSKSFSRANPKQQRWAPKVSNTSKKLNLLQSCSVPVSN